MTTATFEEGSEIQVDSESVVLAEGWADTNSSSHVFRTGPLVNVALRVKNVAKAAALICTLPPEYRPSVPVVDKTGKVEILANGEVKTLEGSTSLESATARVFEITFPAAVAIP